ncbi:ABC transporter ATP-binding protein [Paraherbaspirillum soli]|uniref:ABC transporter ATP-binding protein n=1 Tax=Paraherbaspirillum soli TaxID=631222 RepID=A0ABW0MH56_9BURK
MSALLEIAGLHAFYGQSHVLHGVDLRVGTGEIVSLLGRNGAGRSTTLKAAMGLVRASGSIRFNGQQLIGCPTFRIARHGLAYVPEERAVFPSLTVEQNLLLGLKRGLQGCGSLDAMLHMFPALASRRDTRAGLLSGGEQQMLSLCRSLMGEPALIMVDEPTEGLAPQMVRLVADCLLRLKAQGVSVLLVEQKLAIALEISDRVLVMGHGQIVFAGTPQDLRGDAGVRKKWLEV